MDPISSIPICSSNFMLVEVLVCGTLLFPVCNTHSFTSDLKGPPTEFKRSIPLAGEQGIANNSTVLCQDEKSIRNLILTPHNRPLSAKLIARYKCMKVENDTIVDVLEIRDDYAMVSVPDWHKPKHKWWTFLFMLKRYKLD